jgi:hypothetical protein
VCSLGRTFSYPPHKQEESSSSRRTIANGCNPISSRGTGSTPRSRISNQQSTVVVPPIPSSHRWWLPVRDFRQIHRWSIIHPTVATSATSRLSAAQFILRRHPARISGASCAFLCTWCDRPRGVLRSPKSKHQASKLAGRTIIQPNHPVTHHTSQQRPPLSPTTILPFSFDSPSNCPRLASRITAQSECIAQRIDIHWESLKDGGDTKGGTETSRASFEDERNITRSVSRLSQT